MENTMMVTVNNNLIPVNELKQYLDEIKDGSLTLEEKRRQFVEIKQSVTVIKKKVMDEQIEPLVLIKKVADEYRKMIVEEQEAERRTPERFAKRLAELKEYGLEPETDGLAEQIANDLSYWTKGDRIVTGMLKKIIRMRDKAKEPIPEEDEYVENEHQDSFLLSEVQNVAYKYGAKVTNNPFKKQIVIDY